MSEITGLLERKGELFGEIEKLHTKVTAENRDFTAEEDKAWADLNKEYDAVNGKLERAQRVDKIAKDAVLKKSNRARLGDGDKPAQRWIDRESGAELRCYGKGSGSMTDDAIRDAGGEDRFPGLTIGQMCAAMTRDASERSEVAKRAMGEGTDSAGGFTVPDITSAKFFDQLRKQSTVLDSGAQVINLESKQTTIARIAADAAGGWRAENAAVDVADATLSGLVLTPEVYGVVVKVSHELAQDSVNIAQVLDRMFAASFAEEIDRVALIGSGASNEPTGIVGLGINDFDTSGALVPYDDLVDASKLILDDSGRVPDTAIMAPSEWSTIQKATGSGDGQPLQPPPALSGMNMRVTAALAGEGKLFMGGFEEVVIGLRKRLTVQRLDERFADNMQFGFLAYMRLDIGVARANGLGMISGIT